MVDHKRHIEKLKHDHEMGARRAMMEELFNDYYKRRISVYRMNFVRGCSLDLVACLAVLLWWRLWYGY